MNSYIWKGLECEICKAAFPDKVTSKKGHEIQLLNYNIHNNCSNYVILESVTQSSSHNKTMHVCNFEDYQLIKVGRGAAADIRISDISVSRFHSNLFFSDDGQLTIVDNHSKFGTLKLLREPL